jgi:hypothetical protein
MDYVDEYDARELAKRYPNGLRIIEDKSQEGAG